MKYFFPLDSNLTEHIFAPFFDSEHSHWIPVKADGLKGLEVDRNTLWDSTSFSWSGAQGAAEFSLMILAPFDTRDNDKIIICFSLPKEAHLQVALLDSKREICSGWSDIQQGRGLRQEIVIKVSELRGLRGLLMQKMQFEGLMLRVVSERTDIGMLALYWFGLRNSIAYEHKVKARKIFRPDWSPWILPLDAWGEIRFERGLLFDVSALDGVRSKITRKGWQENFVLLESKAVEYLQRDPEKDFGEYLPNHDTRYLRESEHGRNAYHWEALVLAFVGLVKEDRPMIQHALRYLMCMVHTRSWTESADHDIPSSTWTHLAFMGEMTTTSVAILLDWLGFALFDRTKALIRKALWDRGIAPVIRDISSSVALHQMNQGAVFCRAVVLGGLMLERGWPKFESGIIDSSYDTMCRIMDGYIRPDGGVHEGIGYLCQTLTATLWTTIAYGRARNIDWQNEIKNRYANVGSYVAAMSTSQPGMAIPSGDCRVDWFGGDAIPIFAAIFPDSPFSHILQNSLVAGSVHELTGTLSKSGGMIGMVHGPDDVHQSHNITSSRALLPETGKASLVIEDEGFPCIRLWVSGSPQRATHTHRDHGQFCLEVNGELIFVDRGMVQYWFLEAHFLSRSWLHNVLTPVALDGSYPNQVTTDESNSISFIDGLKGICVPGDGIWPGQIENYKRCFLIEGAGKIKIQDSLSLPKQTFLAFHLHSPLPFELDGCRASLVQNGFKLDVSFEWANKVTCKEVLFDLHKKPVYHLLAISDALAGAVVLDTLITVVSSR